MTTLREKNKARNDLKRAKKQRNNPADLTALARAFHTFFQEYKKVSRAEKRRENKVEAPTVQTQSARNFAKFSKQVLDDHCSNTIDTEFEHKTTSLEYTVLLLGCMNSPPGCPMPLHHNTPLPARCNYHSRNHQGDKEGSSEPTRPNHLPCDQALPVPHPCTS